MIFDHHITYKRKGKFHHRISRGTVELRFYQPLYNEVHGITNDIVQPEQIDIKCMEQYLDIIERLPITWF